jgi:hypothetical protein
VQAHAFARLTRFARDSLRRVGNAGTLAEILSCNSGCTTVKRMPTGLWKCLPVVVASVALALPVDAQQPATRWYRGNTHTHTSNTDGDSSPDVVVRWYREHDYDFLVITDHNFITDVGPLNALFGAAGRFLVISGQEINGDAIAPPSTRLLPIHVNALGISQVIWPWRDGGRPSSSIREVFRRHVEETRRAGGIAQVNHPNFRWAVPLSELMDLPDSTLLEVWNANPGVYPAGGVDSAGVEMPSDEAKWDSLLTAGRIIFGVADDDSHIFRPAGADSADLARPGRGWVMVRADTLTPSAILSSLRHGDFYSSTGVTLGRYQADQRGIELEIVPVGDRRYLTEFIGSGGRVLARSYSRLARYVISGSEGYVRARVTDSAGRKAWTQPVFVRE